MQSWYKGIEISETQHTVITITKEQAKDVGFWRALINTRNILQGVHPSTPTVSVGYALDFIRDLISHYCMCSSSRDTGINVVREHTDIKEQYIDSGWVTTPRIFVVVKGSNEI
jgi:hypothetical protein